MSGFPNITDPLAAVDSVFTRKGAVVAVAGDYFGTVAAALTGVTSGTTRFVGSLTVGAVPASGTFALGDFTVNDDGSVWVCTAAGTPGTWINVATGLASNVRPGFEIAYDQITANVNIVSTTEGTPTAVIAGTSKTYENVPYLFEFFSQQVSDSSAAAGTLTVLLIQDGASIGRIASLDSVTVTTQIVSSLTGRMRFTPTAGAHTFGVSAFVSSTTGGPAIGAGAGGSGVVVPAFLRATKA